VPVVAIIGSDASPNAIKDRVIQIVVVLFFPMVLRLWQFRKEHASSDTDDEC
jgi:hypothetical protein